jgi:hypothetical protein
LQDGASGSLLYREYTRPQLLDRLNRGSCDVEPQSFGGGGRGHHNGGAGHAAGHGTHEAHHGGHGGGHARHTHGHDGGGSHAAAHLPGRAATQRLLAALTGRGGGAGSTVVRHGHVSYRDLHVIGAWVGVAG